MNPVDVAEIVRGDPIEAMEAAKRLVRSASDQDNPEPLLYVARNRTNAMWARIAAIYALGLISRARGAQSALAEILVDDKEPAEIRSYAAEALGNMRASNYEGALRHVLNSAASAEVIKYCRYALGQIRRHP